MKIYNIGISVVLVNYIIISITKHLLVLYKVYQKNNYLWNVKTNVYYNNYKV